jgi:hypothetical protein
VRDQFLLLCQLLFSLRLHFLQPSLPQLLEFAVLHQ